MQVSLYSSGLKQQTILSTPKTATPLMPLPTPHLMKFNTKINQTSLDFILLVARLTSSYIQRTERSYHQEILKAFLSRLVSMLANLIHVFSSAHHHLQPPSSHLMLMILVSSVTLLLKSDFSNHRFANTSPSKT